MLDNYRPQLEKPAWKFVLIYGFSWAVTVFLATTAFDLYRGKQLSFRSALIGLAYGAFFRWYLSRRMKKLQSKRSAA